MLKPKKNTSMACRVLILNYGMGNLLSIYRKIVNKDVYVEVSGELDSLKKADKIILPGVGHFGKAVNNLISLGLIDALNEEVLMRRKPVLGICLGMQLLAKTSEEGNAEGLGWLDASVVRLNLSDTLRFKNPHTGWNTIQIEKESVLMSQIKPQSEFYFVHAYHMLCNDSANILNTTTYGCQFVSAVQKDNIFGVQYHPEKSHQSGNLLLDNFIRI